MLRYTTDRARPGLVALYDIRPGNGAGQFLQPRSLHGAVDIEKQIKYVKVKGQWMLNRHIIFDSVLMVPAKNYQNQSVLDKITACRTAATVIFSPVHSSMLLDGAEKPKECWKTSVLNDNHVAYLPEPDNLLTAFSVGLVSGASLPVVDVNFLHSTQNQLQQNSTRR